HRWSALVSRSGRAAGRRFAGVEVGVRRAAAPGRFGAPPLPGTRPGRTPGAGFARAATAFPPATPAGGFANPPGGPAGAPVVGRAAAAWARTGSGGAGGTAGRGDPLTAGGADTGAERKSVVEGGRDEAGGR